MLKYLKHVMTFIQRKCVPYFVPTARVGGLIAVCILAAASMQSGVAAVITDRKDFKVTHQFRLEPGGTVVPRVTAYYFDHAWVRDPNLRSDVNPAVQPPGFDPAGFDRSDSIGRVSNSSANGNNNGLVNRGSFAVPATGIAFPPGAVTTANVPPGPNSAQANSRFGVSPFGVGGAVSGAIQVDGFAQAVFDTVTRQPSPSEAYAFGFAQVTANGGTKLKNGNIQWRPDIRATIAGAAAAGNLRKENVRRAKDPIDFQVTDLVTGEILSGTLLDITLDMFGEGDFLWDSAAGLFKTNAENLLFSIVIDSPYTLQTGNLMMEILDGVVVTADDSGMFEGILPLIGTSGELTIPLGEITLDYNFGDFGGHELDVTIDFSGSGQALASIPEPDTLLLLIAGLTGWSLSRAVNRRRRNRRQTTGDRPRFSGISNPKKPWPCFLMFSHTFTQLT
ncbi:hypothetical protein [Candidatus Nitrotoga sp. 1052]|uniref:hypothetical protein n=1 Tax=Candidatus Nitrotoga sp. 1052 TaxID=2886964 RepID=UPI001EF71DAB|nr:hypothetical protein [Candidatus Nitrotoga sp. 1052]CAH1076227.1 hypothetical protein NTG1052_290036 [Candidatus Nitrotoga sp. 1052]